jgi:hypothetical protein
MNRQQLARLLRAACDVTKDPEVLVMGSQAVLGTWDEDELPPEATASMEVDIAFLDDGPDRKKADMVEGAIGELSQMHAAEGIYAEGISVSTAILPDGWQTRLCTWGLASSAPARPLFLEPHDLCVAKLMAGREKDYQFVGALISAAMVQPRIIEERLAMLSAETHKVAIARALRFVQRSVSAPDRRPPA